MKPSDFRLDEYGQWCATLPKENGVFHGRSVGVSIDRLRADEREPRPADMALLAGIINELLMILSVAEREFDRYEVDSDASYAEQIANPHIWISGERKDSDAWTFVVERSDWPDYGCHLEFRGNQFCKIWAGD
jgi:hypothetical protein